MFGVLFLMCSVLCDIQNCSINDPGVVLYIHYQKWCSACKGFDPTIMKMIGNIANNNIPIQIKKIDCDACNCDISNVNSYPTVILRENGLELGRFSGSRTCTYVSDWMDSLLCKQNGIYTSIRNCQGQNPIVYNVFSNPKGNFAMCQY